MRFLSPRDSTPGLSERFTLRACANRLLRLNEFGPDDMLVPMIAVAPMGWSWALHLCQSVLNAAFDECGFGSSQRILDGTIPPALARDKDIAVAGYVDNFAVLSTSAAAANAGHDALSTHLS